MISRCGMLVCLPERSLYVILQGNEPQQLEGHACRRLYPIDTSGGFI